PDAVCRGRGEILVCLAVSHRGSGTRECLPSQPAARAGTNSRIKPMSMTRSYPKIPGFRLGIHVFKDAEIVDFAAPAGVFSVARRFDPELDVFLIADAMRPVQAQAGFTDVPNYSFNARPAMNAFLIPDGFGTLQETRNGRLHEYIRALPETTLLTSVCTGSWIYGAMGLLDGKTAAHRKEPHPAPHSQFCDGAHRH